MVEATIEGIKWLITGGHWSILFLAGSVAGNVWLLRLVLRITAERVEKDFEHDLRLLQTVERSSAISEKVVDVLREATREIKAARQERRKRPQ